MKRITLEALRAAVAAQADAVTGMLVERAILLPAWELVAPKEDQRGVISAVVDMASCDFDLEVIKRAVSFFTATELQVTELATGGKYLVGSVGYRAGPAGDH